MFLSPILHFDPRPPPLIALRNTVELSLVFAIAIAPTGETGEIHRGAPCCVHFTT